MTHIQNLFTKADVKKFHALIAEGLPTKDIAERMGRTYRSISGFANRNNVKLNGKRCKQRDGVKPVKTTQKQSVSLRNGHAIHKSISLSTYVMEGVDNQPFGTGCRNIFGNPRDLMNCGNPIERGVYCGKCHKRLIQETRPRFVPIMVAVPVVIELH